MKIKVISALFAIITCLAPIYGQGKKKVKSPPVANVSAPEVEIDHMVLKIGMTKEEVALAIPRYYNINKHSDDEVWIVYKEKDIMIATIYFKDGKARGINKHWNRYLAKDNILSAITVICDIMTQFNQKYGSVDFKNYAKTTVENGIVTRNIWISANRRTLFINSVDYTASADRSEIKVTIDILEQIY